MGIFSPLQVLIMQMMAIATGWSEARLMPLVKEGKSFTPWMIIFPLILRGKKNKLWLWFADRQFKRPSFKHHLPDYHYSFREKDLLHLP